MEQSKLELQWRLEGSNESFMSWLLARLNTKDNHYRISCLEDYEIQEFDGLKIENQRLLEENTRLRQELEAFKKTETPYERWNREALNFPNTIRDLHICALEDGASPELYIQDYMAGKGSHITLAEAKHLIQLHVTSCQDNTPK